MSLEDRPIDLSAGKKARDSFEALLTKLRGREDMEEAVHAVSGYLDDLVVKLQGAKQTVNCAFLTPFALIANDALERESRVLGSQR